MNQSGKCCLSCLIRQFLLGGCMRQIVQSDKVHMIFLSWFSLCHCYRQNIGPDEALVWPRMFLLCIVVIYFNYFSGLLVSINQNFKAKYFGNFEFLLSWVKPTFWNSEISFPSLFHEMLYVYLIHQKEKLWKVNNLTVWICDNINKTQKNRALVLLVRKIHFIYTFVKCKIEIDIWSIHLNA